MDRLGNAKHQRHGMQKLSHSTFFARLSELSDSRDIAVKCNNTASAIRGLLSSGIFLMVSPFLDRANTLLTSRGTDAPQVELGA